MKKLTVILIILLFSITLVAQANTSEKLLELQSAHKKAMQSFGHVFLMNSNFSYGASKGNIVSIACSKNEMSFYQKTNLQTLYTHLSIENSRSDELVLTFDNRVTFAGSTYNLKYKMTYNFGETVGCTVTMLDNQRWDWKKCWNCIKCASGQIGNLFKAYKECGTNLECWLNKYSELIELYNCVVDNCIPCFKKQ